MPEHETFDLDAEFDHLQRDIASSSRPPGAAAARARARHRRRTTVGVGVAVVVLALAGTTTGIAVHRHSSAIGPADGTLPTPAALTSTALSTATSGWTSDWSAITQDSDPTAAANDQLSNLSCLNRLDISPLDKPTGRGAGAFTTSAGQVAVLVGWEFKAGSPDPDSAGAAVDEAVDTCGPTTTIPASYGDDGRVSFYEIPGKTDQPDLQFWTARLDNRLALLAVAGAEDPPSPDTVSSIDDALMSAMQVDATFTSDPSLSSGGVATGSGTSSGGNDPTFPEVSEASLRAAFGSWSSGLDHGQPATTTHMPNVPCTATDADLDTTSASGMSLGSSGIESTYDFASPADAQAGFGTLVAQLSSCTSTTYTVRTLAGQGASSVTVATARTPEPATVWIVQADRYIAAVAIGGGSNPPDSVSHAVGALLADQLTHPQANPSDAPDPSKQGEPSSSSSSAAAPRP